MNLTCKTCFNTNGEDETWLRNQKMNFNETILWGQ